MPLAEKPIYPNPENLDLDSRKEARGLTMLEDFTGRAMQGLCSGEYYRGNENEVANWALDIAKKTIFALEAEERRRVAAMRSSD